MLKCLRIAVTALCLTACMLLIALWVRSYYLIDAFQISFPFMRARIFSETGVVVTWIVHNNNDERSFWMTMPLNEVFSLFSTKSVQIEPANIQVPHWILVILSAGFAASPWFPWRYSLRTLLVATTLVAVGLGVILAATS
jgi:hypothetical protein